jgi:NAD(P)-dependent dehydrogenase (short-subunit alcohol dehydrogenase family)
VSVAVVTGGASGIGLSLARALGSEGRQVLIADRTARDLDRAVQVLADSGVRAGACLVDVRDPAALESVAEAAAALGPIEVLCCNAGVTTERANVWDGPQERFDFAFGVNLHGLLHTLRAFVPRLIETSSPSSVVVTASMAGLTESPGTGAYAASKAAVIAVTRILRAELAATSPHIGVALLCPGLVKTSLARTSAAQQPEGALSPATVEATHTALNEYGVEPDEVAAWVLDAIAARRFWVLPPVTDPFTAMLMSGLAELSGAIGKGVQVEP